MSPRSLSLAVDLASPLHMCTQARAVVRVFFRLPVCLCATFATMAGSHVVVRRAGGGVRYQADAHAVAIPPLRLACRLCVMLARADATRLPKLVKRHCLLQEVR